MAPPPQDAAFVAKSTNAVLATHKARLAPRRAVVMPTLIIGKRLTGITGVAH
jgi:hypothetical protein